MKKTLENIAKKLKRHPIVSIAAAALFSYMAFANRYELGNLFFYHNRPGIFLEFEARSCRDIGPTEYYTVLATPKARAENAELASLKIEEDEGTTESLELSGKSTFVEFECGTFGKPPKPYSWYTITVKDSLGNIGKKKFWSVSGLRYLKQVAGRKNFDGIEDHREAMRDWNNRFWNHAKGIGSDPGSPP